MNKKIIKAVWLSVTIIAVIAMLIFTLLPAFGI